MIRRSVVAAWGLGLCLSIGCSGEADGDGQAEDDVLEVYTWLSIPGEAEALEALLEVFRRESPQTTVIITAITDPIVAAEQLETRMASGSPPDTFQTTGGVELLRWVVANGKDDQDSKMDSVDFLAEESGWATTVPKSVRDLVSFDGKMYGVPLSVDRFTNLFYNKQVFAERGLNPPTTLEEFYEVGRALQEDGIVPLALGSKDGWPMTLLTFESVLVAKAGGDFHYSYLKGQEQADDARIGEALNETVKMLDYTNTDRDVLTWFDAAHLVVEGKAAMTIMGDWATGYFSSQGMQADVDFGKIAPPSTQGTFVYVVNTFGLPKGASNRAATVNFLKVVGSAEGQDAFNPISGTIPPRTDSDSSLYSPLTRKTLEDFQSSTLTPAYSILANYEFGLELDDVMRQFAQDRDVDHVTRFLQNRYDQLQDGF